ncbi:MAG: serine protein kinase PrkA [Deltaproteobacteria bacterium]|nr:serine protein kinase PrkA [Deltaproteobacteria bacterium]
METWIEESQKTYSERRSILSFDDYLAELKQKPKLHLRNAAQYFWDVIQHFGSYDLELPTGAQKRYRIFDTEFSNKDGKVLGHEQVQENLVRMIYNFLRSGRIDRLILLHGPNGSAKTSLIHALIQGAEYYSHQPEGVLYRFNWVFPPKKTLQGSIGFSEETGSNVQSYAYLEGDQIESRINCEYKDHPVLLLPTEAREALLKEIAPDLHIADIFKKGDLAAKNKRIFDALLANYHGNYQEVYKHIQVERFYFSRRYRTGIGSVEPQMSVDAFAKQITADQTLGQLPYMLQHVTMFESGGALSDGHRGLVEYSDLLKRPIESWKYLLVATEQGEVSLDVVSMFIDMLMLASSNELHLNGFREYPDWQSFKSRFELIKVPYLLRFSDELKIYENQIPKALNSMHIAPHALEVAARWAVLTRLESPKAGKLSETQDNILKSLSPIEKLELYDSGAIPERLTQQEAKELKPLIPVLYQQYANDREYEGCFGASPREIRTILLNAAQHHNFDYLSPVAVFEEIRELVHEKTSYEFLRREPVGAYRNSEQFIDTVEKHYLKQVDDEIKNSLGLIEPKSHIDLLVRYIHHVSAWTKKEKVHNPVTSRLEPPDAGLMSDVERILIAKNENPDDFRHAIITKIGAAKLEQPDSPVDYQTIFAGHLRKLKEDYYAKQSKTVQHILESYLKLEEGDLEHVEEKDKTQSKTLKENMFKLGYTEASAKQVIAYVSQSSYH